MDAVCGGIRRSFETQAEITVETDAGILSNDIAMPLALIVNELVTNAVKHARKGGERVQVGVALSREDGVWTLRVRDDGPGFELVAPKRGASGLGLVAGLARQLSGSLSVTNEHGAVCLVSFPETPRS